MDKKVVKFKADYSNTKKKVADFKKKLRELRKEITPIAKMAEHLYKHGNKTMYNENEYGIISKFNGLSDIMEDLEYWRDLDIKLRSLIENMF